MQAAVDAYARTGHMLDAALAYAAYGIPVFPLSARSKAPIPKRDKDEQGNEIPRTGGFYKATCDPAIIHKWWDRTQNLIGVPMGPRSGVWAVDVDTDQDHDADGITAWKTLLAEHGDIHTREHITASGGLHVLLSYPDDQHIGCKRGSIPNGIEIKGAGGYIVMPPSKRKGKFYTVGSDIDPIRAPAWLIDMIGTRPAELKRNGTDHVRLEDANTATRNARRNAACDCDGIPADLIELASAVAAIPNDDVPWDLWTEMALAIYAATQGRGIAIFAAWSAKSSKYDPAKTRQRWQEISGSPPDRFGVRGHYIYNLARANGWLPRTTPTYPEATFSDLDAARDKVRQVICDFLTLDEQLKNAFQLFAEANGVEPTPPAWAMRIDTGVGKTRIVVEEIAKSGKSGVVYAVPTHKLGGEIERQFARHGVIARVFRGRTADDPENAGLKMCLNLDAVELAMELHADISKTCCEYKGQLCCFYNRCGYQRQKFPRPQVWIAATDTIFHHQGAFGKPGTLVIDESFWRKAIKGIDGDDWIVPFAALASGDQGRRDLAAELSTQDDDGGLQRRCVKDMDAASLGHMIKVEWAKMPKIELHPGMSDAEVNRFRSKTKVIEKIVLARRFIKILEEVRCMIELPDIKVSGRISLDEKNSQRVIRWRGVSPISKMFRVPTLLLDATLPDLPVLQVLHPEVEIVADIRVAMPPSVHIRQLLDAPTSSRKLIETTRLRNRDQHLNAVLRYIIQRWIEIGKEPSLVICQMYVAKWLKDKLPDGITVAHYNAIAGLDNFKDVRLLILAGRTQPGPEAIEILAGILSGSMPDRVSSGSEGFAWYQQVRRGIRLRDGTGVAVDGDQHPDPFAESVRQLITEAELIQALGRGRAVNRTEQTPLDVDLLFNTCLPVTVDTVANWRKPSLLIETAVQGVMLTSPTEMVQIWPMIWKNTRAADRTLAMGIPKLPTFERIKYQLAGAKMKPRVAWFDRTLIPDPRAWLEARLGPLTILS